MRWWELVDSVAALVALPIAVWVVLYGRRRWLGRRGATFDCSLRVIATTARQPRRPAHGWMLGLGRYADDDLEWFRVFSLSLSPKRVLPRSVAMTNRRVPEAAESYTLYVGHVVIGLETPTGPVELAMSTEALTSFLAWTEAAPPGPRRVVS